MKDAYIAAKDRWAAKMAGRVRPAVRSTDRLPPGQRRVTNFPVLDLGLHPEVPVNLQPPRVRRHVENPVTPARQSLLPATAWHGTGRHGEPALPR